MKERRRHREDVSAKIDAESDKMMEKIREAV
jgi:hypothetical protein